MKLGFLFLLFTLSWTCFGTTSEEANQQLHALIEAREFDLLEKALEAPLEAELSPESFTLIAEAGRIPLLMKATSNLSISAEAREQALRRAVELGLIEVVKVLLPSDGSALPENLQNLLKESRGSLELSNFLISRGADPFEKTETWALIVPGTEEAARAYRNTDGLNYLHLAIDQKDLQKAELLVKLGLDLESRDNSGNTALLRAQKNQDREAVDSLLASGAEINAQDDSGQSLLMLAFEDRDYEFVKELHSRGADIDLQDNEGFTPLMKAAAMGEEGVVSMILDLGADRDKTNKTFKTAIDIARESGFDDLARRMEDY